MSAIDKFLEKTAITNRFVLWFKENFPPEIYSYIAEDKFNICQYLSERKLFADDIYPKYPEAIWSLLRLKATSSQNYVSVLAWLAKQPGSDQIHFCCGFQAFTVQQACKITAELLLTTKSI